VFRASPLRWAPRTASPVTRAVIGVGQGANARSPQPTADLSLSEEQVGPACWPRVVPIIRTAPEVKIEAKIRSTQIAKLAPAAKGAKSGQTRNRSSDSRWSRIRAGKELIQTPELINDVQARCGRA